ncbi:hypothetical protein NLI96_g1411 [Meripilus lineatus]|uniref:Uncharacterized protein n=1 Tax=Meripilus lineatus TaxID=2056292 RepID=A0AAD5YMZ8_9APHY|nr:hypothetical protein NLI96_g1411 [Physisporinus lineatus]
MQSSSETFSPPPSTPTPSRPTPSFSFHFIMMSTHMDPGFLVKPSWPDTGFGAFADRVKFTCPLHYSPLPKNAITREPPLKPAPISPITKEVFKRNIELVNENTLVEFRAKSLKVLIEKDRDTIASQEVLISEYKDKLAVSEAKGRILEEQLGNTVSHAQKLREDTCVLSGGLSDAATQIKFFESELRHKKARVLALEVAARDSIAKLDTVTGELETTRATLGLEISQLEAQLAQVRKEKEEKGVALQEEVKKLAESGKELEATKARLATEEVEKAELKVALEAMEAKSAALEKALEEKEAELVQAHKDILAAKEEIARLEATLKSTQEDLVGTQDCLAREREDFALARQKHIVIEGNLTNKCADLETSLAHTTEVLTGTQSELEDTKSTLCLTQDQLTFTESTVRERDATIRNKNEEISGMHKQAAENRERAQANANALNARILGLQDEVTETRNNWKEEADGLRDRIGEEKDKLESALEEFEAFKEDANNRSASLEGRVDTLTGELEVKGLELEATADKLRKSDDKVGDLATQLSTVSQENEDLVDKVNSLTTTLEAKEHVLDVTRGELEISKGEANVLSSQLLEKTNELLDTTTALEQARRDAEEQEKATIENNAVLEGRISTLTNALEDSQSGLRTSEDKVLALNTRLAEKDAALETLAQTHQTESAAFEDRIALLTNDLDASQREVQASNAEVAALQLQLAEQGEKLGTAQGVVEEMRVQHDDEVAKLKAYILALENELEASKASSPTAPTSFDDDIETPLLQPASHPEEPTLEQSDVTGEAEESDNFKSDCRPPPMDFAKLTSIQPSCDAPMTSGESARLSATAVAFVPRSVPIPNAPRLHATAPAFVPRQPAMNNAATSLTPLAAPFVPRQITRPQLRGEAISFIPRREPSAAPLPAPPVIVSLRLSANAAEVVPDVSSVVLIPPQVGKIHGLNQEHEVPSTDTDSNTSGVPESVSSASLSTDSTLEFDDSIEAITRRESNYELSQLDSSKSLVKIASLISCPCLRVSF